MLLMNTNIIYSISNFAGTMIKKVLCCKSVFRVMLHF